MERTSRPPRSACRTRAEHPPHRRLERRLGWLVLPLAGALLFAAQADGATLTVQANVVGACSVNDDTLEFSDAYVSGQETDVDSLVSVVVECPSGVTVDIKLGPGNDDDGTDRFMRNGDELLRYNLFKTAARTEVWGDDTFASPKRVTPWDATGDRSQQIHGRIFGGQAVSSGPYSDTVSLTVDVIPSAGS